MRTSVVFVILLGVVRTVHGVCDRPTGGPNMDLFTDVTFPAPDGTSVTFTCQVGHRSVGSGTVACSAGTWSSLNMRCEKFNCGSAGEVINGNVDYSEGTEFGAYARVVCNDGYMVVGQLTVYCGSRGWQGRLATCEVIMCDAPNPIVDGYFSPVKEAYEYSEVITYSCEGQHKLNGSKTVTCQENGQFHPAPPKCVLVNCPEPRVDNGMLAGGARPPYGHMSSVTFRCAVGHTMEGRDTVTCDINSKWSPALPKCNPIECKAPEITNGEVVDGARPTYKFEETVTLKCNTGYSLSGQSTLTCKEKDQWSAPLPVCTQDKAGNGGETQTSWGALWGAFWPLSQLLLLLLEVTLDSGRKRRELRKDPRELHKTQKL
uniref:Sushi domain-containing protein n=1 Tax=Neogobius melanostomus TaxID=47308 RepID=A0A8C6S953_9GOBI